MSVGGSALVDTGSQSTIFSCAFFHRVFAHMRECSDTPPRLQEPCTKFKGKGQNPIIITAQVPFTTIAIRALTRHFRVTMSITPFRTIGLTICLPRIVLSSTLIRMSFYCCSQHSIVRARLSSKLS